MTTAIAAAKRVIRSLLPPKVMMKHIVASEMKHGEAELLLLDRLCDKDSATVDVGANLGIYSYVASRYAGRVFALEPVPDMVDWLRKTAPVNVTVMPVAASDSEGRHTLYIPSIGGVVFNTRASLRRDANPDAELRPIEIKTMPLDNIDFGRVGFLKIDVEGHEGAVLRGAANLLRRDRPAIQIESEERHTQDAVASTVRFLAGFGYRGYFWRDGLHPVAHFDKDRDQRLENWREGGWSKHAYINNFLFFHPEGRDVLARFPVATELAA